MEWALVLTLCAVLNNGSEQCDDYIADVLPNVAECLTALDAHKGQPADRYYSCAPVQATAPEKVLIKGNLFPVNTPGNAENEK